MSLSELENELINNIDENYFELEDSFQPFEKLVEIFSSDVNEDEEGKKREGGTEHRESEHPKLDDVQKQVELCNRVMEAITHEHQASLINSVQEMGGVYDHYIKMRRSITNMRNEIAESKSLILSCSQLDRERQLFNSKTQNENVLELLNALELVRDAPSNFDELVRQKRFVAAVDLLNTSLHHVFSSDLVNVEAIGRIAFDLVERKGLVLDHLVSELARVLFHDTTPKNEGNSGDMIVGKDSDWSPFIQEHSSHGSPCFSRFSRETNPHKKTESFFLHRNSKSFHLSTPTQLVPSDSVDLDTENGLKDPSAEDSLYTRLLVEAIFRLDAIHDAWRHLLERIKEGVECLSAGNMRACGAVLEDLRNQDVIDSESRTDYPQSMEFNNSFSLFTQFDNSLENGWSRLINYLRMSYGSFSGVIRNSVQLARLIQYQEQCQENEKAVAAGEEGNTGTNVETVPLRCDLTCILWAEMQENLIFVIQKHINTTPQKLKTMFVFGFGKKQSPTKNEGSNHDQQLTLNDLPPHGMEFDHTTARLYLRDAWLCKPTPLAFISVFRQAKQFVDVNMKMIHKLEEHQRTAALISRKCKDDTKVKMMGGDNEPLTEMLKLDDFLSHVVRDILIPALMCDSNSMNARIAADSEAFLPWGGMLTSMSVGGTGGGGVPLVERNILKGTVSPGKAVAIAYVQIMPIFRAMACIDEFCTSISSAAVISLLNFYTVARNKLNEEIDTLPAYKAYQQCPKQFHDILLEDEAYLQYKASQYGESLRLLSSIKTKHTGAANTKDKDAFLDNTLDNTFQRMGIEADTVAEKVFQSEYHLLKEFSDSLPIGIRSRGGSGSLFLGTWSSSPSKDESRSSQLLHSGNIRAIACIALSCDWLASRVLYMCQFIEARRSKRRQHLSGVVPANTLDPVKVEEDSSSSPNLQQYGAKTISGQQTQKESVSKTSRWTSGMETNDEYDESIQKIRAVADQLSSLSNDCLLALRLSTSYAVIKYLSQLEYTVQPESLGATEKQKPTSDEICVASLCRVLQTLQQTFLPVEHEQEDGSSIAAKELFAYVENAATTTVGLRAKKKILFQTFTSICKRVDDTLSTALGHSPSHVFGHKCSDILNSTSLLLSQQQQSPPSQDVTNA